MKKRIFFKILPLVFLTAAWSSPSSKKMQEYYRLTVYQYTSAAQEAVLNNYLQNALLPALHRNGIKAVGVFKAIANDTAAVKKMYVLLPVKKLDQIDALEK